MFLALFYRADGLVWTIIAILRRKGCSVTGFLFLDFDRRVALWTGSYFPSLCTVEVLKMNHIFFFLYAHCGGNNFYSKFFSFLAVIIAAVKRIR